MLKEVEYTAYFVHTRSSGRFILFKSTPEAFLRGRFLLMWVAWEPHFVLVQAMCRFGAAYFVHARSSGRFILFKSRCFTWFTKARAHGHKTYRQTDRLCNTFIFICRSFRSMPRPGLTRPGQGPANFHSTGSGGAVGVD